MNSLSLSLLLLGSVLFILQLVVVSTGPVPTEKPPLCYTKCSSNGTYTLCDWNFDLVRITSCANNPKGLTGCRCYKDYENEDTCECVDPRQPPKFPSTGVLRWNGTLDFEETDDKFEKGIYTHPGEIHKDGKGRYLRIWTNSHHWSHYNLVKKSLFEIIIPKADGIGFTKYKGDNTSKICKKYDVKYTRGLDFIWAGRDYDGKPFYQLQSETNESDTLVHQKWKRYVIGDSHHETWIWDVVYNVDEGHAIPVRQHRFMYDGFIHYTEDYTFDYAYQPLQSDEEITFRLEDYCSDFGVKEKCDVKK